eukprot:495364-Alexandrium_andersonii.AAC.1
MCIRDSGSVPSGSLTVRSFLFFAGHLANGPRASARSLYSARCVRQRLMRAAKLRRRRRCL